MSQQISTQTNSSYHVTEYQQVLIKLTHEDPNTITNEDKEYIVDFISTNKYNQTILGIYANLMEDAYTKYTQKMRHQQQRNRWCCCLFI
jgi:hypothetical protein